MNNHSAAALLMVILGGFFQASFMLPANWSKQWNFEHLWLAFSFFCYLLLPWAVVSGCVSNFLSVLSATPNSTLLSMSLYATGWSLAALSFGIGINRIGLSLGFAIIFGLAAFVGALVPLLLNSDQKPTKVAGIVACLILMLAGVAYCSRAGRWREKHTPLSRGHYTRGVLFCAVSGLLGASGNLGFLAGSGMVQVAEAQGNSTFAANSLVLAYLCLFMFLLNAGYALGLLCRRATFPLFLRRNTPRYLLYSLLMGLLWMASFLLYSQGARLLGSLGLSLGWGVFMCTVVISANVIGILSREWQNAPHHAWRNLATGIGCLITAVVGLILCNRTL